MATLLLGYTGPRFLLLTFVGERPLLLECPPELRRTAAPPADEDEAEFRPPSTMPEAPPLVRTRPRIDPDRVWQDEAPPPPTDRPRPPEKHLDPRTAFKRRGHAPPAGTTRSIPPATIKAADQPTHDHVIVSSNPTFRASDQGIKALIVYLRTSQILVAKAEKITPEGTTIDLLPDVFSHLAFTEGAAPSGAPSVLEGRVWFGSKPAPLPFSDPPGRTSFLRIELFGARFARLSEAFLARIHQILYLRPEALATEHDPERLRTKSARVAAEPIPRFDMQEV